MKIDVKLACKYIFTPVYTSDGHPMLLVRPMAGQEDARRLNCYKKVIDTKALLCYSVNVLNALRQQVPQGVSRQRLPRNIQSSCDVLNQ